MNDFNHHVYIISYSDSLEGPIKIGYSNHPPTRLKQLQTGSPRELCIYGNLGFKEELAAKAVEKIFLSYLIDNDVRAKGEWYNIGVKLALSIFNFFPDNKEKLDEPSEVDIKGGIIKNFINLIHYRLTKGKINEDEYDLLNEIFEDRFGDKEEERFEFTSAIK